MKIASLLLIFISLTFVADTQPLYWPRDIKKAYKKQTRSNDGWPGIKYWQNTGTYNITVTAMPPTGI